MKTVLKFVVGSFLTALMLSGIAFAKDGARVILVLDASGSMWGQIDGKPKMDIAKQTVGKIIGNWRVQDELGLVVYGHREKGSCTDIEVVRKPGKLNKQSFMNAVNGLVPKGKTPMTDAVRMAAQSLKFTEKEATVILVSDGIETCAPDPCAIASELEKLGINFTVHTVGFNIASEKAKAQLECLAKNTGGKALNADNAKELEIAIREVVRETQAPVAVEPKVTLRAVDEKSGRIIEKHFDWAIINPADENVVAEKKATRKFSLVLKPGKYRVVAEGRVMAGSSEFEVKAGQAQNVDVPIKDLTPKASLKAPEKVVGATKFDVKWSGPGYKYDEIRVWDATGNRGDGKRVRFKRISLDSDIVTIVAPTKTGEYELRYWSYKARKTIGTRKITVTELTVDLKVPETVAGGSKFKVEWQGPGQKYDEIVVWDPSAKGGDGKVLRRKRLNRETNSLKFVAPTKPGTYEVKYWQYNDRKFIKTVSLSVTETKVSLGIPQSVVGARRMKIEWSGPGQRYDEIVIWDPSAKGGDGKALRKSRLKEDSNIIKLVAPLKAGQYEVRYWQYNDRKFIKSVPFSVTQSPPVELSGPASVKANDSFKMKWSGPAQRNDRLEIWDMAAKGGDGRKVYSRGIDQDNEVLKLRAPKKPGQYVVRYWQYDNRAHLGSFKLTITE